MLKMAKFRPKYGHLGPKLRGNKFIILFLERIGNNPSCRGSRQNINTINYGKSGHYRISIRPNCNFLQSDTDGKMERNDFLNILTFLSRDKNWGNSCFNFFLKNFTIWLNMPKLKRVSGKNGFSHPKSISFYSWIKGKN